MKRQENDETCVANSRMSGCLKLDALPRSALLIILRYVAVDETSKCGFQDLLHLSRTCKYLYKVIKDTDDVWKEAFVSSFGKDAVLMASEDVETGRVTWKEKVQENKRMLTLRLSARKLKLTSEIQSLEHDMYQIQQRIHQEKRNIDELSFQLKSLERARQNSDRIKLQRELQKTYWHPQNVVTSRGLHVEQLPKDLEAHESELRSSVALAQIEHETLLKSLRSRSQKLQRARHRLQILNP